MFYKTLHAKVSSLYNVQLDANGNEYKKVSDAFKRAAKYLHSKGGFSSSDLTNKEVKPLINETYKVLKSAVKEGITTNVPTEMLHKLQSDVFVFSGMKTYAQLKEASLLMLDEKQQIKPYAKFEQDISKIDATYNKNYLQAEQQTAIATAQSVAQYQEYMQDADRYDLQIRTAADDKVRDLHAAMNGITLAANHPFWNTNWTPFDWRCRCRIIQVRKGKYSITDIDIASKAAEKGTSEIFKFNPGKEQIIFPPKHPYYSTSKNALEVVKGLQQEEHKQSTSIDLNKYIKNNVTTKITKDVLMEYASKFPENFKNGLETVKFASSKKYLMQHSINVNRVTRERVGKSTISISNQTFGNGFNPAKEFMDGLASIKKGKELTFNQEYSFEAMWHEILHTKTATKSLHLSSTQIKHMETVNQFVARHTYPKFIEAFGGKATNQQQILEEGYGYKTWVKEFRNELAKKAISETKALEFLEPHLMKDYSSLGKKIDELLQN